MYSKETIIKMIKDKAIFEYPIFDDNHVKFRDWSELFRTFFTRSAIDLRVKNNDKVDIL